MAFKGGVVIGPVSFNASGAATSIIGTGGTGIVNIGNATGNTFVTGSLTTTTTLTATLGDITATSGNLVLTAATTASVGQITQAGNIILHTFGTNNIFVGKTAGNTVNTLTGSENTSVGVNSGTTLTSGSSNTFLGYNAGNVIDSGSQNVALGTGALDSLISTNDNIAIGFASLTGATTASENIAIGTQALQALVSGTGNLAIGKTCGSAYTGSESSNILLKNNGMGGESGVIRIGTGGSQSKCFISGIRGVTTDVNDAIPVLIDSTGQLGTVSSSKRYKENIEDMCCESANVMHLKPVTFTYKNDPTYKLQYGLIAEEVAEVFPKLVIYNSDGSPETVKYHELPVLLLNEMQKLNDRIKDLEKKLDML